jgi:hypothetical protein
MTRWLPWLGHLLALIIVWWALLFPLQHPITPGLMSPMRAFQIYTAGAIWAFYIIVYPWYYAKKKTRKDLLPKT